MKVKSITFDSTKTETYAVSDYGVQTIQEFMPSQHNPHWHYLVTQRDGRVFRVFNPKVVEYFPKDTLSTDKDRSMFQNIVIEVAERLRNEFNPGGSMYIPPSTYQYIEALDELRMAARSTKNLYDFAKERMEETKINPFKP